MAENKYGNVTETCAAELMSGLQIRGKKANTKQEHGFRCKMTEVQKDGWVSQHSVQICATHMQTRRHVFCFKAQGKLRADKETDKNHHISSKWWDDNTEICFWAQLHHYPRLFPALGRQN